MWGEAWASLAEKVFGYFTDERGLAELQKRRQIASIRKEITDAIARKDWKLAADKLDALRRLSDAC